MSLLLESIKVINKKCPLLDYHLARIEHSSRTLFGKAPKLDGLSKIILGKASEASDSGVYKIRFLYNWSSYKIEMEPYQIRSIRSLRCIHDNSIAYTYKFTDRSALDSLYDLRYNTDDILIIKNDLVTDTYYANVAFYDGANWITPSQPLLKGTRRSSLLQSDKIIEGIVAKEDIPNFEQLALFNGMIDLGEVVLPVSKIIL